MFSGTMFIYTNKEIELRERMAMVFFVASYHIILTIAALPFLVKALPIFVKERSNGLIDTGPYVISVLIG